MNDVSNLADTIKPKSDQLNADDLLTGPITVKVMDVKRGPSDQPVHIHIQGQQPFKPCKTMRRVLITAWGSTGSDWVGKSMTLYCDPTVKFGGVALGGIRISHLSHINGIQNMMLTQSRGRKAQVVIKPLEVTDYSLIISNYTELNQAGRDKMWLTLSQEEQIAINAAFK
jgi:hypothetical protein